MTDSRAPFLAFAASHGLTLDVTALDWRDLPEHVRTFKGRDDWNSPASQSHYKTVLRKGRNSMTLYYSMGSAHKSAPDMADILNTIALDLSARGYSFGEFCDSFGYNEDSRHDERIYKAVKSQNDRALRLLGNDAASELQEIEGL